MLVSEGELHFPWKLFLSLRFPNYLFRHILESLFFVSFDNYFVNLCFYLIKISLSSCCHIIWIFPRQFIITFNVSPTFIIFLISNFIFIHSSAFS